MGLLESKRRKLRYSPVNPTFPYMKWDLHESSFYGHVIVMTNCTISVRPAERNIVTCLEQ